MVPSAAARGPNLLESSVIGNDTFNIAPTNRLNVEADLYIRTPLNVE
jgi:hypothetical protein